MLNSLFRRLTADPVSGEPLFAAATDEARLPHWYREGAVADTIDGRFAALATVVSLIILRLEREGQSGDALSVALTERFIAVMESEHRELGLGDPTLGRTVRKLVGSLARRTDSGVRPKAASGRGWKPRSKVFIASRRPTGRQAWFRGLQAFRLRLDASTSPRLPRAGWNERPIRPCPERRADP